MTDNEMEINDVAMVEDAEPKRRQRRQMSAQEIISRSKAAPSKRVKIILEENEAIPPTGLPLQHNGRAIVIMPGEIVEIPQEYLEILDHAVMSSPVVDPQTKQVLGYRDRLRYSYRRLN